jgi:TolB-like protein
MDDRKRIAAIIRDHLARERISREQFAFKTKLGKSTVDKLLIGLFSAKTLSVIEGQTGLALRTSPPPEPAAPRAVLAGPDPPSIAVLPFTNMSGDPEQEYFADGITEDITTALSHLRWLFVIARNSTFTYKGRAVDVRQVALELAVRYVLEGSVRTSGGRIRVTGQLVDAANGKHIWAERYDRELRDIFAVQDEITGNVVASIEPHLYAEEGIRAANQPPESIDAWGLVVRALGLINRVSHRQNEEAQTLLQRAIGIEPGYAKAHAVLGWAVWWATMAYWRLDSQEGYRQAQRHPRMPFRSTRRSRGAG